MVEYLRRSAWAHRPAAHQPTQIADRQPRVWLHHGAAGSSSIATARSYLTHHLGKGWADIGYSWLIAEGKVLEGRGRGRQGAHTFGDNHNSYGICMVGNYQTRLPERRDIDALVWLLQHGAARGWFDAPEITGGHRDAPGANTSCPGDALWAHIDDINRQAADEEDDMTAEQDARLKRIEQTVAELAGLVGDLHVSVGGRSVANDLRRIRISQRALAGGVGVPVDNGGPDDGTVVIS